MTNSLMGSLACCCFTGREPPPPPPPQDFLLLQAVQARVGSVEFPTGSCRYKDTVSTEEQSRPTAHLHKIQSLPLQI